MAAGAVRKYLKKGEYLFKYGHDAEYVHVIQEGQGAVYLKEKQDDADDLMGMAGELDPNDPRESTFYANVGNRCAHHSL